MSSSHALAVLNSHLEHDRAPIFVALRHPIGMGLRHRLGEFRRVLVAESDQALRVSLRRMLSAWGFDVVLARHGAEALKILMEQRPPDLAILDRTLAGIDGVELCRRISEQRSEFSPHVFILAKRSETRDVVRALESGADEYLTAPIEERELKARLAAASRILKRRNDLIISREAFRDEATRDALTGVWTRRAILEILDVELGRPDRTPASTGVLLLDLDHFKSVNDTYGHLAGDQVLAEASRRLSRQLRSYDAIGRYGGEEFMVIAPGCGRQELCELAERLRAAIESEPFRVTPSAITITVSIGAMVAPSTAAPARDSIAAADAALYAAKKAGRNRIAWHASRPPKLGSPSQCPRTL
jgi:two-component system, cell cycle response regulator